jgi:signal peptidase II
LIWYTAVIAILVVVSDQITKHLAQIHLNPVISVTVIAPFFDLILVRNRGAAFGIMSGMADPYRMIVFSLISISAVLLLIYIYRSRPAGNRLIPCAIGLVAGGAVGNWIDRIRFGFVIDFIDWHAGTYHWPTFNIADSCITVGVTLLLIQMLLEDRKQHAS